MDPQLEFGRDEADRFFCWQMYEQDKRRLRPLPWNRYQKIVAGPDEVLEEEKEEEEEEEELIHNDENGDPLLLAIDDDDDGREEQTTMAMMEVEVAEEEEEDSGQPLFVRKCLPDPTPAPTNGHPHFDDTTEDTPAQQQQPQQQPQQPQQPQPVQKLKCLDMFAGCGGLSIGLEDAGIEMCWAIERDKDCVRTYKQVHPDAKVFCEEVEDWYLRLLAGKDPKLPRPGEVDIMCGGPPCQGLSASNRYRHLDDPRNSLVKIFLLTAQHLQPRYLLIENVTGIVGLAQGRIMCWIQRKLIQSDYQMRMGVLQAGNYGVPQSRWRFFVLAAKRPYILPTFPKPTHNFPAVTNAFNGNSKRLRHLYYKGMGAPLPMVTVGDAIGDLPRIPEEFVDSCPEWGKCKVWGSRISEYMRTPCHPYQALMRSKGKARNKKEKLYDHVVKALGPKTIQYRRLHDTDEPFKKLQWGWKFPTIVTNIVLHRAPYAHPEEPRAVSPRECARAQGFPDWVHFAGKVQSMYKQVGNAVPPPLAYALGKQMAAAFNRTQKKEEDQENA